MRLSRLIKSEPSLLTKSKNFFMCSYLVHRSLFLDFSRVSACLVLNKISYKLIKKSLPPTQGHLGRWCGARDHGNFRLSGNLQKLKGNWEALPMTP